MRFYESTRTLFVLIIACTFFSCEGEVDFVDPYEKASLQVTVTGTLSFKPREGLKVCVYETEEDAEKRQNPITSTKETNNEGKVIWSNLIPNQRYFVRVDATLNSNINESPLLWPGENEMNMKIL